MSWPGLVCACTRWCICRIISEMEGARVWSRSLAVQTMSSFHNSRNRTQTHSTAQRGLRNIKFVYHLHILLSPIQNQERENICISCMYTTKTNASAACTGTNAAIRGLTREAKRKTFSSRTRPASPRACCSVEPDKGEEVEI